MAIATVVTIAPSWPVKKKSDYIQGVHGLQKLGFTVLDAQGVASPLSLQQKLRQLYLAFSHKQANIVMAQRGGYGSMKLLPLIDFSRLKKHSKILAGFSDFSALLNGIYEKTGIITLHSPMLVHFHDAPLLTRMSFLNAVEGFPEKNLFVGTKVSVLRSGNAQGILKGGNLITLTALLGTSWEIATNGCILFFEEVDEKLHAVDRCLTQWLLAGKLKHIKGLILGNCKGLTPKEVYSILSTQMKVDVPVVYCPNIGHIADKITLPVGARVMLTTKQRKLILL
jgi:muramoyltetrapeptide carboxypeptidase